MPPPPQSILQDNMKIIKKTHKGEEVVSLEEEMREALYVTLANRCLACPVSACWPIAALLACFTPWFFFFFAF
jgi:hypothetical protein